MTRTAAFGDYAFCMCSYLTSITIPDSVTDIGDEAFSFCAKTLTVTVDRGSCAEQYCKDNGLNYTCSDAPD